MLRKIVKLLSGVVSFTALTAATPPPKFPAGNTVDVINGQSVSDPFRELEDGSNAKVVAWSDAQNDRTRTYLDGLAGRAQIAEKLGRLIRSASPSYHDLQARGDRIFAIYLDPAKQQPSLVTINKSGDPATRRALVDPNLIDTGGHTSIDWYVASPDGSKVAVSLSEGGSEDGTLHVFDVSNAREIEAPITRVQYPTAGGSLAWTSDSGAFWYTRYPGENAPADEQHFNQALWFHRLGTDLASDSLALSSEDGVPRTGEIFLDNRNGGAAALASVQLGDGGQWQQFVLRQGQRALRIAAYEDRIVSAAIAKDGTIIGLSRLGAPMGKLLKLAAPYTGGFAKAKTIVAERKDAAITDGGYGRFPLAVAGNRLFVQQIAGGPSVVTIYDLNGGNAKDLPLPPIAAVTEVEPLPSGDVIYSVSTYLEPTYFAKRSARDGRITRLGLDQISPVSFADASVIREFATSKDGTKIPLNIIAKRNIKLDGTNPTLLYGYGGYGLSESPSFLGTFARLWLDAGGVYVLANIRGGGEYGDKWHRQGMLTKKQNVFDDFAAVAEDLIRRKYTSHDHLALIGASNGGLLMGATLTQHPELAKAVVSDSGIYDMVRSELDSNGDFNTSEFGTVKDPAEFAALYAYSPYHHIRMGTRYPSLLLLTGANDGRVNPMHSRKFAALLQMAQSGGGVTFLRTSKATGHGFGSSLDDRILLRTDQLMFLYDQLGMDVLAAAK